MSSSLSINRNTPFIYNAPQSSVPKSKEITHPIKATKIELSEETKNSRGGLGFLAAGGCLTILGALGAVYTYFHVNKNSRSKSYSFRH
jgi:hypothetical protein